MGSLAEKIIKGLLVLKNLGLLRVILSIDTEAPFPAFRLSRDGPETTTIQSQQFFKWGQNVFLSLELHLSLQREYFCSVCALNSCVSSRMPEKEVNFILRTSIVASRWLGC